MPRLVALLAALALASCGDTEPQRTAAPSETPKSSPEQLRTESLRALRQRQHELVTEAERVDAAIVVEKREETVFEADLPRDYLALPEEAKIVAVREFLKDSRYTADLAAKLAPEANKEVRARAETRVSLCEQRIALHGQRAQVERDIAALGEKP
jgi:hypothetical protein